MKMFRPVAAPAVVLLGSAPALAILYGPGHCVSLSQSSTGSCVLATDCEDQDTSQFEFAFDCQNATGSDIVRHSFGHGGFDPNEEFDSQVVCERCLPPSGPVVPRLHASAGVAALANRTAAAPAGVAALANASASTSGAKTLAPPFLAVRNQWTFTSSEGDVTQSDGVVHYGPKGCVSTFKSKEGHCLIKTNCEEKDISNYSFGLVCVDKIGAPVRHLFGKDSFDPVEQFDTLLPCDQCLGLEDVPERVAMSGQVLVLDEQIKGLQVMMENVTNSVAQLNAAVFQKSAEAANGEKAKAADGEKEKAGGEKGKADGEKEKAADGEKEKAGGEKGKADGEKEKADGEKEKAADGEKEKADGEKERADSEKEKAADDQKEKADSEKATAAVVTAAVESSQPQATEAPKVQLAAAAPQPAAQPAAEVHLAQQRHSRERSRRHSAKHKLHRRAHHKKRRRSRSPPHQLAPEADSGAGADPGAEVAEVAQVAAAARAAAVARPSPEPPLSLGASAATRATISGTRAASANAEGPAASDGLDADPTLAVAQSSPGGAPPRSPLAVISEEAATAEAEAQEEAEDKAPPSADGEAAAGEFEAEGGIGPAEGGTGSTQMGGDIGGVLVADTSNNADESVDESAPSADQSTPDVQVAQAPPNSGEVNDGFDD